MHIRESEKSFIISTKTLVLKTTRNEHRIKTYVIEDEKQFILPRKPLHIIRSTCRYYGTSLTAVTQGAREILNDRHKVPIIVGVDRGFPLILIPTLSPRADDNIWISFHAIVRFKAIKAGYTEILLSNGLFLQVPVSEPIIQRQIALAHLLQVNYQRKFFKTYGNFLHRPHLNP